MDASSKNRVLVASVALIMVLSALAVFFQGPMNSNATVGQNGNYLAGERATGNQVAPMISTNFATVQTYMVTFTGIGLPAGASWSITVDGNNTLSSTGTSITFSLPNGSHTFEVNNPINYIADPASGVVFVYGATGTQYITFTLLEYSVTFAQTGLPSGSSWAVNLSGEVKTSTGDNIIFSKDNGSYNYTITGPANYAPSPANGKAVVYGENVTVNVAFASTLHRITFNFNGDTADTSWTLKFAGDSYTVTASSLALVRENGLYTYSIETEKEYSATPATGSVLVVDGDSAVNVSIQLKTYTVTFEHVGIDTGTPWKVTFDGQTLNSNSSTITFVVPAGNYSYTISDVNGYTTSSNGGTVNVASQDQYISVPFSKNPDVWTGPLLIIAGAAIGIAAGIGIGMVYVRRRKPP